MAMSRDRYESWIASRLEPRFPELVAPLRAALDALERIRIQERTDPADLRSLVDLLRSPRRPLYENGADLIRELTADRAEVRDAVAELASDKKAHVRFNAILCLSDVTPPEFSVMILRQALLDGSARVRQKVADWALRLKLAELTPDLERASLKEKRAATKKTIDFSLRLLRDGYVVEEASGDSVSITVPRNGSIVGRYFSRAEFEAKGGAALAAEMRNR